MGISARIHSSGCPSIVKERLIAGVCMLLLDQDTGGATGQAQQTTPSSERLWWKPSYQEREKQMERENILQQLSECIDCASKGSTPELPTLSEWTYIIWVPGGHRPDIVELLLWHCQEEGMARKELSWSHFSSPTEWMFCTECSWFSVSYGFLWARVVNHVTGELWQRIVPSLYSLVLHFVADSHLVLKINGALVFNQL